MAVVTAACLGLRSCAVPTNYLSFGADPCSGTAKNLAASVTCTGNGTCCVVHHLKGRYPLPPPPSYFPAVICGYVLEHQTLSLSCANFGAGVVMTSVLFASFGRPTGSCPNGFTATSSCHAANSSVATVNATCLGRSSCSLLAEPTTFGNYDPCYGLGKMLAVMAVCGNSTGRGEILEA